MMGYDCVGKEKASPTSPAPFPLIAFSVGDGLTSSLTHTASQTFLLSSSSLSLSHLPDQPSQDDYEGCKLFPRRLDHCRSFLSITSIACQRLITSPQRRPRQSYGKFARRNKQTDLVGQLHHSLLPSTSSNSSCQSSCSSSHLHLPYPSKPSACHPGPCIVPSCRQANACFHRLPKTCIGSLARGRQRPRSLESKGSVI